MTEGEILIVHPRTRSRSPGVDKLIASFSHDFIFVKTRKTGGTSAEIVLSAWCSGEDICTPITPDDERVRAAYGGRPMNHLGQARRCYNHMSAGEIEAVVPSLWARAYRFAVDRHPFEKVVSRAWWNVGRRGGSIDEIGGEIDAAITSRSYLNHPLYYADGRLLVDRLVRYEEMWTAIQDLAGTLGTSLPAVLPRAKGDFRQDKRTAEDILSADQKARILRDAEVEFALLEYR